MYDSNKPGKFKKPGPQVSALRMRSFYIKFKYSLLDSERIKFFCKTINSGNRIIAL